MLDSEGIYQSLLEAAPDAFVGVDDHGIIQVVNAQTEHLFGYSRSDLVGQSVEMLVPAVARGVHPQMRTEFVQHPRARPMGAGRDLAARRKDGTEFPAEISLSVVRTDQGPLICAAVRDVSERVEAQAERERLRAEAHRERLESRMHQSQRLESLGQLAGGVAHDFNNLLGAILNYATFVSEELERLAPGDLGILAVRDDVAQIRRAAERGAELTHQLLTFGRREIVQLQVLNINDAVHNVEHLLRRTIGEHVELSTDLSTDLQLVKADPGQLEQVLMNLAINSRDAMPSGGVLRIETRMVDADEEYVAQHTGMREGRYVQLRVSDNGAGMSRSVVMHAFEPFFTTKPKGQGTGLGLATVYGVVTQAGGAVHIYSEVGFGTSVNTLWPVTDSSVAPPRPAPAVGVAGGGETVLVVEDEGAMREVVRRILVRDGYRVLIADSGPDAIEIAAQDGLNIDVLLTDVIMPQMLGKEVAEHVSAHQPGVRTLFMSGYAEPILSSQGTLDEGVVLLEKPFTAEGLRLKLREVIERSSPTVSEEPA